MGSEYANPYPQAQDTWQTALQKMAVLYGKWASGQLTVPSSGTGFVVPENDEQITVYYGATNNINTITYKLGGQVVATENRVYAVQPPVANDALLARRTITPA